MRWAVMGAIGFAALTACIVSIDESKLDAQPENGDDDNDAKPKKDAGKSTPADGGTGGELKDVLVEAATIEAGVVLPATCKEVLDKTPGAATGPTAIGFENQALTVYCDQATRGGGWTMMHRLSAGPGITGDPLTFYNSIGLHDTELGEITPKKTATHYTSRILNHWNVDFPVKDAMVRVYDAAGNPLKEVVFDATASSFTSFFLPERLVASSWTDLAKDVSFSDFTIQGSNDILRRFNIVRKYATCPEDSGWLIVHGSAATVACDNYELPSDHIRIYYAPGTTSQKWPDGVSDASSMAVFVR